MPWLVYRSEGIVLGGRNFGEADRLIYLLTAELGLLKAVARGVRQLRSKLRPGLQDFTHGEFSLVRGAEFWRLTGAVPSGLTAPLLSDQKKRQLLARLGQLLRRLLPAEGEAKSLFSELKTSLIALAGREWRPLELSNFELVLVARILYRLGYLAALPELQDFADASTNRERLRQAVNAALRESML